MPALNDYDKNDEDAGGLSEGFTPAQSSAVGSSNGPKQATPPKQQEDSYVPWSSFVDANKDVSDREAGKLAGQVQGDVNKAQGELSTAQQGFDNSVGNNYGQPATAAPKTPGNRGNSVAAAPGVGATPAQPTPRDRQAVTAAPGVAAPPRSQTAVATPPQAQQPQQATTQQGYTDANGNFQFSGGTPPPASGGQQGATVGPWAAFAGAHAAPPLAAAVTSSTNPTLSALQGYGRAMKLGANTAANGAQGPKDLEAQAGQQGWAQLLGDTTKAQQEANALGSETGVQGILQKNASSPTNSAFDAALINGQGAPRFQALNKEYGGGKLAQNVINAEQASQSGWNQLGGDVATRQAFDAAAQGAPAPGAATSAAPTSGGSFSISSTNGANGQFDASQLPPDFDPSQSQGYQSALQQLAQAAPLPEYAKTPADLIASKQATSFWPAWAKQLGMTADQLTSLVKGMPQWQYELFARGIVPANIDPTGAGGYFEGFMPVSVQAQGAGTDPKYQAFKTAMDVYEKAIEIAASATGGGAAVAGYEAAKNAVSNSAKNPNNTGDPLGNRG